VNKKKIAQVAWLFDDALGVENVVLLCSLGRHAFRHLKCLVSIWDVPHTRFEATRLFGTFRQRAKPMTEVDVMERNNSRRESVRHRVWLQFPPVV
jgi:hypothetical protein